MQVSFKAQTVELTDEVRSYAEAKVAMLTKLLQNVEQENIQAEVALEKKQKQQSGDIYRADITIHAGPDRTHAVGHGESIMASIDKAKDDLALRLSKVKNKKRSSFREGSAKIKKMLRFWE